MDVTLPAHRDRIPQRPRNGLHRTNHILSRLRLRMYRLAFTESPRRQHGSIPGAKVLGREVLAGDLAQVIVDVAGVDGMTFSIIVYILKQLIAGKILQSFDNSREVPIRNADAM